MFFQRLFHNRTNGRHAQTRKALRKLLFEFLQLRDFYQPFDLW